MSGMEIPYYFIPFPTEIVTDHIELSLAEYRLLGYLLHHRNMLDSPVMRLTHDEIMNGRIDADGSRVDSGCFITCARDVKKARSRLEKLGWLITEDSPNGIVYSLKFKPRKPAKGQNALLPESAKCTQEECKMHPETVQNALPIHKEVRSKNIEEPLSSPKGSDMTEPNLSDKKKKGKDPLKGSKSFGDPVKIIASLSDDVWVQEQLLGLWNYFKQQTKKHPKLYQLTETRARMGLNRLRDCYKVKPDKEAAVNLFRIAIDNLAENDFLAGNNSNQKIYQEWDDHLCKDWKTFEKRLREK